MLRKPILALSASNSVRELVSRLPVTRDVVARFVAGETVPEMIDVVTRLQHDGLAVTADFLGEDTTTIAQAEATTAGYLELLDAMQQADVVAGSEFSIKLSALGQALAAGPGGQSGADYATGNARRIAEAAYAAGARVHLDMEDHRTVDATLNTLAQLRSDFPDVGIAIQAMLLRTPKDLVELTGPGSRVRLVKGAYNEPDSVAHTDPQQVDLAYVRALKTLMNGQGYPMVGSHDPTMIAIADRLAADAGRSKNSWEYQMLYGIRPAEQQRLVAAGHTVRVYVPYGQDWYGYFTRRLAERPANLMFFLRSFGTKK
ncbi:proline dehydrogenase family protein [Nakamurella aerolata]|uniref:proline dehydrogenase n=1 Tax=Nakamurella aerolata TaxID=1656892 RepID=A0A849A7U3_9ACTN|nr:proline dehydrogenase family protein [Nakamurella aerolata]NNG37054.1 proline dehydrogenase [Nakamurella aerolata]